MGNSPVKCTLIPHSFPTGDIIRIWLGYRGMVVEHNIMTKAVHRTQIHKSSSSYLIHHRVYRVTWRCCEPTCLSLGSLFDVWPDLHDLWPWYLCLFSSPTSIQQVCKTCFFTWWPWPLTYHLDLWPLTSWPLTLTLVTSTLKATCQIHQIAWKSRFNMVILTYDLDLHTWPRYHPPSTTVLNLITLRQVVLSSDFLSNELFSSHRRTDRRQHIRAHRAWAQVGSKTSL